MQKDRNEGKVYNWVCYSWTMAPPENIILVKKKTILIDFIFPNNF
jgi:hypothetical protein